MHRVLRWMQVNYGTTDAATRWRLFGLLRLSQCSRAYLDWVLSALALNHHCHPDSQAGWFWITPEQASFIAAYAAAASDNDRATLHQGLTCAWICGIDRAPGQPARPPAAWLQGRRRRQCVPPEGLRFSWTCSPVQLQGSHWLSLGIVGTPHACSVAAMGLQWFPRIHHVQGRPAANINLKPDVPAAYQQGQQRTVRLRGADWGFPRPVAMLDAALYLHRRLGGGQREEAQVLTTSSEKLELTGRGGWTYDCIKLTQAPAPPQPQQQEQRGQGQKTQKQTEQDVRALVEAQWADYLEGGVITGCLNIMRPA